MRLNRLGATIVACCGFAASAAAAEPDSKSACCAHDEQPACSTSSCCDVTPVAETTGPGCGSSCSSHACSSDELSDHLKSVAERMPTCGTGCWTEQQIRAFETIELATFSTLPEYAKRKVMEKTTPIEHREKLAPIAKLGMLVRYEEVAHLCDEATFNSMSPVHRHMLKSLDFNNRTAEVPTALCFAPGTDMNIVMAFDQALSGNIDRFQQTNRWNATASSPAGSQGTPTTLTYGYVPDGTFVTNTIGVTGNSNLFAWLNGIYGSPAVWQPLFDQVFDRWEELSGNTYIFEPNDDGSSLDINPGVLGTRADLRIAAIFIDGNSGTLAYNNFPQNGDMVLDSGDNFYNNTTGNSLRLRNIIAHEHGHGSGQLHVCPSNQTKLMEPFISTAYDGPQFDDMLNIQRHYGDFYENNNNVGQATNLGSLSVGNSINIGARNVGTITDPIPSIDDNSDVDYFRLTLNQAMELTVNIQPEGFSYQDGPQTFDCGSGPVVNYLTIHDLAVRFRTTGGTILQTQDVNGFGGSETIIRAFSAGDIIFEVFPVSGTNDIQAYSIDITTSAPPFLDPEITIVGQAPSQLDPGVSEDFTVNIDPRDDTLVGGTALLNFAADGVNFQTAPLSFIGGQQYTATLPGFSCADTPEYFISVEGATAGFVRFPTSASGELSAVVGDFLPVFTDNFETNQGWSVSNSPSLTDGAWERGTPVGGGDRGDPAVDFDGSGQCFLTDNADGNSDVDGGETTLTSPLLDASGSNVIIRYAAWLSNDFGDNPGTASMTVEATGNDGGFWFPINIIGPTGPAVSGGWFEYETELESLGLNTDQFRIRFIVGDPVGAVVEAGVDAVEIVRLDCTDPISPPDNDFCNDAIAVAIGSSVAGDTSAASLDSPSLSDCMPADQFPGNINAPTVWYSFTGNGNDIILSTCDQASYDTAISVYCEGCSTLTCVGGNDDADGCAGFSSEVVVATRNNASYLVAVHGFAVDEFGTFTLSLTDTGTASVDALASCGGDDPAPVACNPADLNDAGSPSPAFPNFGMPDGILTPTDFSAFSFYFSTGDLRADINDAGAPSPAFPNFGQPDGILTPTDFSAFSTYFGAGCPCTLPGCP